MPISNRRDVGNANHAHSTGDRCEARFELGAHSADRGSVGNELRRRAGIELADDSAIAHHPFHVRHEQQLRRPDGGRDRRCCVIPIDVERLTGDIRCGEVGLPSVRDIGR